LNPSSLHTPGGPGVDPALLVRLRRQLTEAGFSEARIRESYGFGSSQDPWSLATGLPARDGSPFSILVTLFCSGSPVEGQEAEAALAPLGLTDLEKLGLVDLRDGRAHPRCLLRPHGDLIVASDLPTRRSDCVLGIVPASETLAHLTVRRPATRALDLGTGCGAQGLLLARHSETVVAIDVNPRALGFASFNAALNEAANVQCREGSWFAPVADERFDVIACNPPYVISPDAAYTYRDSALPRDGVCRMIVRDASDHLSDGGFATILCNWIHDGSWPDTPREWVADTGCDALLLHYGTVEPSAYAARWNGELVSEPRVFETTVRRWIDYYRAEGITGIAFGAAILRRRPGASNWVRALDMAAGPTCPSSDHALRLFEAADFLNCRAGAAEFLGQAFALVDGHRVDQTLQYRAGKYAVGPAIFRLLPGIGLETRIDPRALEVLLECDGRRTLQDLVAETAIRRGEAEGPLAKLVEETSRQLVERGFMIPVVDGKKGGGKC
jgi:methylase of polypeptide subunit release factors